MSAMLDTLQQQLGTSLSAEDGKWAWLLFDAMSTDVRDVLPDAEPDADIHAIPLERDDIPAERRPQLVAIGPHDVECIRASLTFAMQEQADPDNEQARGSAVGGWLVSGAEPSQLLRHLSSCMQPRLAGAGRKYFRWADRRVLEWMWPVLSAGEQTALLGPIGSWWTLDRCNQLVEHRAAASDPPALPWQLTESAWQHAQDCEPVQTLLRGWQRFQPILPPNYLKRATQAVRAARAIGLVTLADIVLVATYTLQIHPNLCAHPSLQAQVQTAREQGRPLADVLAEIPDPEGWDRMRDDLIRATVAVA